MDELLNNPLLKSQNVNKVINDVEIDPTQYMGQAVLPFTTIDDYEVVVDVDKLVGGMTQAVASGAESPLVARRGIKRLRFTPACFREKFVLSADDLNKIRKLGTVSEREKAAETIAKCAKILRNRVETRIEWARWQAIQGSLAVNENGVNFTVDYNLPETFTPSLTGTDMWSDLDDSDPLSDIMDWMRLFRRTGMTPKRAWSNLTVQDYLLKNQSIREIVRNVFASGQPALMTREVLQKLFSTFIGNLEYVVYDKGWFATTELSAGVSAGGTSLSVYSTSGFSVGDTITIISHDGETQEDATISAVGANTITVSAGLDNAYTLGAEVRSWKPFIPDNVFIIEGELPPAALGGTSVGEFISTKSEYGAGGLLNPQAGIFAETQIHDKNDPKSVAIIAGVYGLPVLYRNTAFVVATVA